MKLMTQYKYANLNTKTVPIVTCLVIEELLVQGNAETHIAEGSKVIFQQLPLIIGSMEKVTVTNNEEYNFYGSGLKVTGLKISKLSKVQISLLLLKATWDDLVRDFSIHD